ncbi:hypothetical protein [Selenihalanaerobacter shriftii]|uniref:Uncharacterized protein n=1 Tax=Selenihalanaerobacter shriftii TaxID=142842 RepID=A0A1T4LS78_9FIRM|nr:hypothetical protein [Selenihalanaerobacter shriftii]SJZ57491.1 hypothetical protein SAMN02745118_01227 [Selenihalanaerobacter shriftii]
MVKEITLHLSAEIDGFISDLAYQEEVSQEEVIIKILTNYYYSLDNEGGSDEIPDELAMLKEEENLLTISDTFKKEFNES